MDFFKKPIYKSRTNRKVEGVCAGIANTLDIDPVWIRLLFVFLIFCCGSGLIIYIVLAIVLDNEPIE